MRTLTRPLAVLLGVLFATSLLAQPTQRSASALIAAPPLMRLNGTFRPADGLPAAPVERAVFAIYAQESGGIALWEEMQSVAIDGGGDFVVLLGATRSDGLPPELFATGERRWLGIRFERTAEAEQPRVLLASVPYALFASRAANADTLGNRPASAYLRADMTGAQAVAGDATIAAAAPPPPGAPGTVRRGAPKATAGTSGFLGKFTSATDLGNSAMFENAGKVGLGTAAPLDLMHTRFTDPSGSVTGYAVQNVSAAAGAYAGMLFFDHNGVLGQFQGFNNGTHEYRINNVAPGGTINFMLGGTSKFKVAADGNIDIAGNMRIADGGVRFPDATTQTTNPAAPTRNPRQIATLRWYEASQSGATFAVGSGPDGIAFDGANIWVANFGANTVTKLRASDGACAGVVGPPTAACTFPVGSGPFGVAFDGANIWVGNTGSASVTKLRASDGACAGVIGGPIAACTFAVGGAAGIAFDGANIWVANSSANTVTKLRASDGACAGTVGPPTGACTFGAGSQPVEIAFDGANIWVGNFGANTVTKLRASDGACAGTVGAPTAACTFAVGANPLKLVFDGANIWTVNNGSDSVTKLRASDGACAGVVGPATPGCTFAVGSAPRGATFDGTHIWVANQGTANLTKLRASDGACAGIVGPPTAACTFAAGGVPYVVGFDGINIWVTNNASASVTKL